MEFVVVPVYYMARLIQKFDKGAMKMNKWPKSITFPKIKNVHPVLNTEDMIEGPQLIADLVGGLVRHLNGSDPVGSGASFEN